MYTCSHTHLTSQKEWFLRRLHSAKEEQQGLMVKQLWLTFCMFTTIQHHSREENAARFSMSTCQLTLRVETCPFRGCTSKATRHRAEREPQQCR